MFKSTIMTNDITLPVYNKVGFGKESESAFRNDIWFSKHPEWLYDDELSVTGRIPIKGTAN